MRGDFLRLEGLELASRSQIPFVLFSLAIPFNLTLTLMNTNPDSGSLVRRVNSFVAARNEFARNSVTNRWNVLIHVGQRVRVTCKGAPFVATISAIDKVSNYARAYGAQVSFSDSGYTVTADDCAPYVETMGSNATHASD